MSFGVPAAPPVRWRAWGCTGGVMTDEQNPRRTPRSGRARKRAVRAQAARAGVPYSVAARQLEAVGLQPGETLSSYGRTIYPVVFDSHRELMIRRREQRSFDERVLDNRRAATLPDGRAQHLVERFPPTRGRDGTGVGPLYHGEGRQELLAMLYVVVAAESPGLLPAVGDLVWIAEMGEETALDMACAELDREARRLLDRDPPDPGRAAHRRRRRTRPGHAGPPAPESTRKFPCHHHRRPVGKFRSSPRIPHLARRDEDGRVRTCR
ncbi:hypothetical protein EV382_4955 [Micromonospora violae]|uniref:Uncharacterized protein n=1 Tax=Micromonospora violae TaxID=1278207 RepID=A0A4Q7UJZ1_9ACTN|nr:hypothetical protein EV382_4955 [Micromonospora violae]